MAFVDKPNLWEEHSTRINEDLQPNEEYEGAVECYDMYKVNNFLWILTTTIYTYQVILAYNHFSGEYISNSTFLTIIEIACPRFTKLLIAILYIPLSTIKFVCYLFRTATELIIFNRNNNNNVSVATVPPPSGVLSPDPESYLHEVIVLDALSSRV